ncbi:YrhK family protein [Aquibacillus kalidii]|uniref:YrhK family protein n=1 Tax=Aquibacillus kalidii TaxID=2762597 RepID=UPI001C99B7A7|nr:YrhK family protein [Aquibacillus kalidii]
MDKFKIDNYPNHIDLQIGQHEIIINERYEFFYNLNDVFIALCFLVGSILFLWNSLEVYAIWLFIIGSALFLIRPLLQFTRRFHLKKVQTKKDFHSS